MSSLPDHTHYSNHTGAVSTPLPGLISLHVRNVIVDVISCGIQPIPSLLGMLGNALSLVVLSHQGIKQTTNIVLIGLTLADLLYVAFSAVSVAECLARHLDRPHLAVEIKLLSIVYLEKLASVFGVVSRWYTCFVAVERLLVVRYPLKASSLMKKNRMMVTSVLLWLFAFLSRFYHFLLFEIKEIHDPALNRTKTIAGPTDFLVDNLEKLAVGGVLTGLFSRYIPVLVVFVCTCVILRCLRMSLAERREMRCTLSAAEAQQHQVTKTLVGICAVFLVTSVPGMAVNAARLMFADRGFVDVGRYENSHAVLMAVVLLCNLVNSSVNVLFYVLFNRKFVNTCRHLFGYCWWSGNVRGADLTGDGVEPKTTLSQRVENISD